MNRARRTSPCELANDRSPSTRLRFSATGPVGFTGATLAETLMAMLVMSIGVVSLATLFPLSVIRTLQATQMTNATNLRYNAEARIDMNRTLLTSNAIALAPVLPPPPTEPTTPFAYLIDPLGWNIAAYSNVLTYYRLGGVTGIPRWNGGVNTEAAAADLVTLPDSWNVQAKSLPDTAAATPINTTSVTFPANVDLTSVNYTAPYESRVVVFNNTLRRSQVRRITGIVGQTVSWAATQPLPVSILEDQNGNNTLDAGEDYDGNNILTPIGDVWIETRERRYTWMLNVRRYGNRANVEVVTFFGREFTTDDETAYAASFIGWVGADGTPNTGDDQLGADFQPGIAGFDDDGNGTVDDASEKGWPGSDDNRTIYNVNWTTPRPTIRKGGWLLDATNGRWYRIRAIYEPITHTPVQSFAEITGTSVDLVVEKDLLETSATPIPTVFLRGVIDVFPIGTKEF